MPRKFHVRKKVQTKQGSSYKNEKETLRQILVSYKDRNMVQRILKPKKFPTIPFGEGKVATHQMSTAEVDGKHIAYPNITQNPITKKLELRNGRAAVDHAIKTKDYIPFEDAETADWFSKNYKKTLE